MREPLKNERCGKIVLFSPNTIKVGEILMNTTMFETGTENVPSPEKRVMTREQKRSIFFGCMIAIPVILFVIFYAVVNVDVILMAFKKYELIENNGVFSYKETFVLWDNFKVVFEMLNFTVPGAAASNWVMVTNSLKLWAFKLCLGLPVSIIFSYYVYKKCYASGFFRVILFLPNVISNIIMVYTFRLVVDNAFIDLFYLEMGLTQDPSTSFGTVLFFNLWLGFAAQTLMFTSAMSGIDESIVEAAEMDGVSAMGELWYITLPMIYSTCTTFVVIGIAEIFTDQMSLLTFYDKFDVAIEMRTIGYYLYQQAYLSELVPPTQWSAEQWGGKLSHPQLSAFGVIISAIIIPLSFLVRRVMEKVGPEV